MDIGTPYPRSLHLILFYAFVFFSTISYPPARIREVPVQCSTTFFFPFPFLFAHCRQTSHSLPCPRYFPDPESRVSTIHLSFLALSRVGPWHIPNPTPTPPSPSFIIITGALYVLVSNNMTQRCCYLLYAFLFLFSSIDRVRYHISVNHLSPSASASQQHDILLFFTNPSALCLP
jgi:hypothetical protein